MLLFTISNWPHLLWLTHIKHEKSKVDVYKVRSLYVVFFFSCFGCYISTMCLNFSRKLFEFIHASENLLRSFHFLTFAFHMFVQSFSQTTIYKRKIYIKHSSSYLIEISVRRKNQFLN